VPHAGLIDLSAAWFRLFLTQKANAVILGHKKIDLVAMRYHPNQERIKDAATT